MRKLLPKLQYSGILLAAAFACGQPESLANVGEAYGFGSRSSGLAGAAAAWGFQGYSAYANPAGLPISTDGLGLVRKGQAERLAVSFSIMGADPMFLPIEDVVIENTYESDKMRSGDVDTNYRGTFGQALGLAYRVSESSSFTLGLTTYLPINQVAYMDTGETYHPEYVLYRARTQRPQFDFGAGIALSSALRVGAGLHIAYSLTSSANVIVRTTAGKPSSMRFAGTLKPKAGPYLGLLLTPASKPEDFSIGAVLRFPVTSDNRMSMQTAAAIGAFPAIDFNFSAMSALFYDPLTVELGTAWQHAPGWRLYLQGDYQVWSKFSAPAIEITNGCSDVSDPSCGVPLTPSDLPRFPYRNILIPRIGEEFAIGGITWRLGYAYRPSFLSAVPEGAGNYLDPSKHMVTIGAGLHFENFLGLNAPADLDLHFLWHQLVRQQVAKAPGDETGAGTGDLKIGAPGYDAGGKILGGGVSLNWVF